MDSSFWDEIQNKGTKILLNSGEYLLHEGDKNTIIYFVISGRLRALKKRGSGQFILGDIGIGEPVGELALFTGEPRMASVIAIRKSIVLKITQEEYLKLVAEKPELATTMTSFVIDRLRRNTFEKKRSSPPKTIALVQLDNFTNLDPWISGLKKYKNKAGGLIRIHNQNENQSDHGEEFFASLEEQPGIQILVCNQDDMVWAQQCLLYADLVIVATHFSSDTKLRPIEKQLNLYSYGILNKKTYLLLLHERGGKTAENTQRWFANRNFHLHIHLRRNHQADLNRLGRILTNTATGLVLGGGGAKGYAHLGAVKAMRERGLEVDFIGGASAGAVYGMALDYLEFDQKKLDNVIKDSISRKLTSKDFALPVVSMMKGKKIRKFLKDTFEETNIEDLWINSFCVTTNYNSAKLETHRTGILWRSLLASISVPGIFPPVVLNKNLHIDGSVMDTLPIEPMYDYPVENIIAISLSNLQEAEIDFEETPSGWKLLWDKITQRKRYPIPGFYSIVENSLNLNSMNKQGNISDQASHYWPMDLNQYDFLDDSKWEEIQEQGYFQASKYLDSIPSEKRFWER
ncbi:patatin-like phospholipase family protein [Algoriphagus sediminis]|uniref:Patatin-like phospholipase family protein n=1 Tax=Algoriphagus sediminis TaxID=3057113 RepID=A0ABT7YCM1_9BACT|nr:patatin-like phospholipase family protein [Algoriphagus sediminis]MDN3204135.1 patatin-like phospholipase family protein [Algoriphagus sediminis]